jgi:hypothetical protein
MKITPEAVIQQTVVKEFTNQFCLKQHEPRLIIHSVPNGIVIPLPPRIKSKALDLLHKMGMLNGVSDIIIHGVNNRCVFLEMKAEKGKQSDDQKDFQSRIVALGGYYIIAHTTQEFWTKITPYIGWLKGGELE